MADACGRAIAIAKGGLLRVTNPAMVTVRTCRLSYGISWTEPYDPDLPAHRDHNRDEPKFDPYYGYDVVENRVYWLVKVVC